MNNTTTTIGATITYAYKDDIDNISQAYVSFGQWVEDTPYDTYGVADSNVFYYFENTDELIRATDHNNDDFEFVVTSYSFHYSVPDHCVCPVERLYSAGEVCEYCISVAFFDDPDYAELLGYVLVDDKWVLNNTWTVPPLDNPPTEDGTIEAGGK